MTEKRRAMPERITVEMRADIDLTEIVDHVGQANPAAARRLIDQLEATCRLIASQPGIGRRREDLAPGLRGHPHGAHVIFLPARAIGRADRALPRSRVMRRRAGS